ncbi:hypothetical protein HOC80_00385 [archaeon]|jgi:uncharacterized membrane protein|nr:hypothetical protein [archaeon]MBT4416542.1 hypothetical protein [archaeon]
MKKQKSMKKYVNIGLILACIIVLLIVPAIRWSNGDSFVGEEPFLFLRLAEDVGLTDNLSYSGRFAAYDWGVPLAMSFAPSILIYLLPFIFGLLSFIIFGLILKKLEISRKVRNMSLLLFLLSPCFVYLFSFTNALFLPLFICLLTFYLFMKKSLWTIPLVLILPLFNVILCASLLIVLFFYMQYNEKKSQNHFILLLLLGVITSILYYGYFIFSAGWPGSFGGFSFDPFKRMVFDLGSSFGLGIFVITLAAIGILVSWKNKYENKFLVASLVFLSIFSYLKQDVLVLLNLFIVVIGGYGLYHMLRIKRWNNDTLKKFVLIIIMCGVAFSCLAQFNNLIEEGPNEGVVKALEFLEKQEQGVVFSDYTRGIWINSAGQPNVMDSQYKFAPEVNERYEDSTNFFYTRDVENASLFIEKYDIKYVWVDEELKEEIWDYDTQGLLFLLEYTNQFNKIYYREGVEIWEVTKEE